MCEYDPETPKEDSGLLLGLYYYLSGSVWRDGTSVPSRSERVSMKPYVTEIYT